MSTPTEADREKAREMVYEWDMANVSWTYLYDDIAQALADEREKARAPFLAVMDRCNTCRANAASVNRPAVAMAYDDAAEWIRRASEGDQ